MRYVLITLFCTLMQFQLVRAMDTNTARVTEEFTDSLYSLLYCPENNMGRSNIVSTKNAIGELKSLLEQGAEVDTPCFVENQNFLIVICNTLPSRFENNLQYQLIELLLSFSANPNHRDAYDQSAVEYAAAYNNPAAIEQLVKAGASVCGTTHIPPATLPHIIPLLKLLQYYFHRVHPVTVSIIPAEPPYITHYNHIGKQKNFLYY